MAQSLPYAVSCKGGLNTNLNQFEILTVAGSATVLENFEVDTDASKNQIGTAFRKHAKGKKLNKVLMTKFGKAVA